MLAFGLSAPLAGHVRYVDPRLTPKGPATISTARLGPETNEGTLGAVVLAVTIGVGPGGKPGRFRLRVGWHPQARVSRSYFLPAEPGHYTFPVPPVRWDYRYTRIAIEQETGEHALVVPADCRCELVLTGRTPTRRRGSPTAGRGPFRTRRGRETPAAQATLPARVGGCSLLAQPLLVAGRRQVPAPRAPPGCHARRRDPRAVPRVDLRRGR